MKANKFNTTLTFIITAGIGIILYDSLAGFRGKKGRIFQGIKTNLIGGNEDQKNTDNKLNEISDSIKALTSRLAKIEDALKSTNSFEKRLIFPEKENMMFSDTKNYGITDRRYDDSIFAHSNRDDETHLPLHDDGFIGLNNDFKRLEDVIKTLKNGSSIRSKESHRHFHPRRRLSSTFGGHEFEKENEAANAESANPDPFRSSSKVQKMRIPKFTPKIIHTTEQINFADIVPDFDKEDPIVEVKRFDNYEAFKKFGEDIMNHKAQEKDGADDTNYYKMSDILQSNKNGGKVDKSIKAEAVETGSEGKVEPKVDAKV